MFMMTVTFCSNSNTHKQYGKILFEHSTLLHIQLIYTEASELPHQCNNNDITDDAMSPRATAVWQPRSVHHTEHTRDITVGLSLG